MRCDVRDGVIAAGVAVILVITGLSAHRPESAAAITGVVLLAAGGLALAWRRRFPVAVLIVTGLCAVGYQAAGFDVFAVAYLVAVYAATRAGRRAATVAVSVVMLAALPLTAMASGLPAKSSRSVLELAWLIAAGAAGEALRQAERRADEAERTREQSALRRAGEERLHIARELHDSLTHQISVIKLQAEVAVHLARKRGEPVPDALLAIRDAGREAARELRETLTVLRDDGDFSRYGLQHVPGLLDGVRAAGLTATLTTIGQPGALPPAVDRTGYRIVQESLTNVVRHARAASATVCIDYHPDRVRIRVDDDGAAAPPSPQPGVGLLGMRERVTALGGTLRAEPRDQGGFTVHAELPLTGPS